VLQRSKEPPFVIEYGALGEHALPTLKFLNIQLSSWQLPDFRTGFLLH